MRDGSSPGVVTAVTSRLNAWMALAPSRIRAGSRATVAKERRPDCVLLDYLLPGKDGLEVVRDLRSSGNQVPVIVLTGQGDERLAAEVIRAGATDYLPKNGLTAELIGRALRNALRHCFQCRLPI